MRKVIIIGGGIAGLTAGIYAQQKGYNTEIYEKNPLPGGECTGWDRQGYHIDNCIHWLTGCRPEDGIYKLWQNIGAVSETTQLYREPYFYMLDMNGKQLHFWQDIERSWKEFLSLAPEDTAEINKFFDAVKLAESMKIPWEKSPAHMNTFEFIKLGMSMQDMGKVMKEYGNESVSQLSNRFKNPMVREMMGRYYNMNFMAYILISSYAFFTSKTAAIPMGGSRNMALSIVQRYKALGGILHLNAPAAKINIKGKKAQEIILDDGSAISADYIICTCDPSITYRYLLDKKYMDKNLAKMYNLREGYPVSSAFQAVFGIKGEEAYGLSKGSVIFPCEAFTAGTKLQEYLAIRLYDYDDSLFPKNKRVIQCNILQDEGDFEYWKELYSQPQQYKEKKLQLANLIMEQIVKKYPALENNLILLDTFSPATYEKWCGAYKGAYMSFYGQPGYKSLYVKNTIKGLDNVYLASQWLQLNGGLPSAAASGKFAAQALSQERV